MCASQPAETQDAESAFGSDSSSVLEWKPVEPVNVAMTPVPPPKKPLTALKVQVRDTLFLSSVFILERSGNLFLCRKRTMTAAQTWAT